MCVTCASSWLLSCEQNISFYSHLKGSLPDLCVCVWGGALEVASYSHLLTLNCLYCFHRGDCCSGTESLEIRMPRGKQQQPMAVLYLDESFLSVKLKSVSTYRVIQNKSNFSST